MNNWISLITALLTIAIAVFVSLKCDTKRMQKIIFCCLFIVVISGLGFYGFGLAKPEDTLGTMIINGFKTVGYTISMFGGGEKFDTLMNANGWFASSIFWQITYWIVHLLAVFVTASTLLITWGKKLLNRMKLILPAKKIAILYCNNDKRYAHISKLENEKYRVIYVGNYSKDVNNKLADYAVDYISEQEMDENGQWLKRHLWFKKKDKQIRVLCLNDNDQQNIRFINKLIKSFKNLKVNSEQTSVYVLGENIIDYDFMADLRDENGHRYISEIYSSGELAAHKLMQMAMPYTSVEFDHETCKARESFNSMVIGFGDVGQEVLRYLVRYGQFLGSEFKADVFDCSMNENGGLFSQLYEDMMKRYDINLHNINAFSKDIYGFFNPENKINYLVVCTGDEETNHEIIEDIRLYKRLHEDCFSKKAVIASCTKHKIEIHDGNGEIITLDPTSVSELLSKPVDMIARHINDVDYRKKVTGKEVSKEELADQWYRKDPMDRLSSMSSAEFLRTYIACSGVEGMNKNEVEKLIDEKLIKILPELEHLRWNAFESSMGVTTMSVEEFKENVSKCDGLVEKALKSGDKKDLEAAKKQFAITRKNIGPYGLGGKHVCLTDWEKLDELWKIYEPMLIKYNELMEKNDLRKASTLDFKQLDEKNIYHMLDVL